MAFITDEQKIDILNGKLQIYANIRFDSLLRDQLNILMDEIAPKGDKRYASKRDIFFRYDKERNYWTGNSNMSNFEKPFVKLEHNFIEPYNRIVDICKLYGYDIKHVVIESITSKSNKISDCDSVGSKIPTEIAGHLRAAGLNAIITPYPSTAGVSNRLTIQLT